MRRFAAVLVIAFFVAPGFAQDRDESAENDLVVKVELADVPERVLAVAKEAKPGLYYTKILRVIDEDDDGLYYQFYGSNVGRFWFVQVRSDDQLMLVRQEDEAP